MPAIENKPLALPQVQKSEPVQQGIKPAQLPTGLSDKQQLLADFQFARIQEFRKEFLNS